MPPPQVLELIGTRRTATTYRPGITPIRPRQVFLGISVAATVGAMLVLTTAAVAGSGAAPKVVVTPPVLVASVSAPKGKGISSLSFFSAVADASRRRVYATWSTSYAKSPETRVYVAVSDDGGRTFARPVWLGRDPGGAQSAVRVDARGRVWATWTHYDLKKKDLLDPKISYSNPSWQRLAYSDDGGRTWSVAVDVPANHGSKYSTAFGALAVTPNGRMVTAFWLDYLPVFGYVKGLHEVGREAATYLAATSTDGGRNFGPVRRIVHAGCVCCEPFGLSANGRTALLFRGWQRATLKHDRRDIKFTIATPTGWTRPVSVHDDNFLLNHCPSVGPAGVADRAGRVHVVWWTGATGRAAYWYAIRSADGTFGAPVKIQDQPSAPNENNATLALDASGTLWTATVAHGQFKSDNTEDKSPNLVRVYRIGADGRPRPVPTATVAGGFPQLVATRGAVVQLWYHNGRLLARRIVAR